MAEPHVVNLPPSAEAALQEQARTILETYINGNKSTARAMMGQIPKKRIAYITMWLMFFAGNTNTKEDMSRLICSVTE